MSDLLKTIQTRHSCRKYTDVPVTQEQIDELVKAALAAPTAFDAQPFKLLVISNKEIIQDLNDQAMVIIEATNKPYYEKIMERGGKPYYNANVMFVILKETNNPQAGDGLGDINTGIMAQNLALAAYGLDLGSVIAQSAGIPFGGANGAQLKAKVGWPEGYDYGVGVLVGNPDMTKEPHELSFDKVVYTK